eukprot:403353458
MKNSSAGRLTQFPENLAAGYSNYNNYNQNVPNLTSKVGLPPIYQKTKNIAYGKPKRNHQKSLSHDQTSTDYYQNTLSTNDNDNQQYVQTQQGFPSSILLYNVGIKKLMDQELLASIEQLSFIESEEDRDSKKFDEKRAIEKNIVQMREQIQNLENKLDKQMKFQKQGNNHFDDHYQQMKAATKMRNIFRNTSSQVIQQSGQAHLKDNLFMRNCTNLDVQTFNFDSFPRLLNPKSKIIDLKNITEQDIQREQEIAQSQINQYSEKLQEVFKNSPLFKQLSGGNINDQSEKTLGSGMNQSLKQKSNITEGSMDSRDDKITHDQIQREIQTLQTLEDKISSLQKQIQQLEEIKTQKSMQSQFHATFTTQGGESPNFGPKTNSDGTYSQNNQYQTAVKQKVDVLIEKLFNKNKSLLPSITQDQNLRSNILSKAKAYNLMNQLRPGQQQYPHQNSLPTTKPPSSAQFMKQANNSSVNRFSGQAMNSDTYHAHSKNLMMQNLYNKNYLNAFNNKAQNSAINGRSNRQNSALFRREKLSQLLTLGKKKISEKFSNYNQGDANRHGRFLSRQNAKEINIVNKNSRSLQIGNSMSSTVQIGDEEEYCTDDSNSFLEDQSPNQRDTELKLSEQLSIKAKSPDLQENKRVLQSFRRFEKDYSNTSSPLNLQLITDFKQNRMQELLSKKSVNSPSVNGNNSSQTYKGRQQVFFNPNSQLALGKQQSQNSIGSSLSGISPIINQTMLNSNKIEPFQIEKQQQTQSPPRQIESDMAKIMLENLHKQNNYNLNSQKLKHQSTLSQFAHQNNHIKSTSNPLINKRQKNISQIIPEMKESMENSRSLIAQSLKLPAFSQSKINSEDTNQLPNNVQLSQRGQSNMTNSIFSDKEKLKSQKLEKVKRLLAFAQKRASQHQSNMEIINENSDKFSVQQNGQQSQQSIYNNKSLNNQQQIVSPRSAQNKSSLSKASNQFNSMGSLNIQAAIKKQLQLSQQSSPPRGIIKLQKAEQYENDDFVEAFQSNQKIPTYNYGNKIYKLRVKQIIMDRCLIDQIFIIKNSMLILKNFLTKCRIT